MTEGYPQTKKFRRNKQDGVLGGVCAGLADYTGWDLLLIRIVALVGLFFTGFVFFVYIVMWIITPAMPATPVPNFAATAADNGKGPVRRSTFTEVSQRFRDLEQRLQDMEKSVTSGEWKLRRQFREIE